MATEVHEPGQHCRDRLAATRLCVLDVDGTLLRSDHLLSSPTREAVAAVRQAGVDVMLASSRGVSALEPVLDALGDRAGELVIAAQGAVLGRYSGQGDLQVLVHCPAPVAAAKRLVRDARARGLSVSWYTPSAWLVPSVDDAIAREADLTRATPVVVDLEQQTTGPDKVMVVSDRGDTGPLHELAEELPAVLAGQFSHPNYLEVTAAGVGKASALRRYCTVAGLSASQVLAVGDGLNDLDLLGLAGISAAPANARPEVLAAVDFVTPSNDDDGIAELLDRLTHLRTGTEDTR